MIFRRSFVTWLVLVIAGIIFGYSFHGYVLKYRCNKLVKDAESFVKENPTNVKKWVILGNYQYFAMDYKGAMDAYKKAITLDNACIDAYEGLGVCYLQQGMLEDAGRILRKALVISSTNDLDATYRIKNILTYLAEIKSKD